MVVVRGLLVVDVWLRSWLGYFGGGCDGDIYLSW